MNIKNIFLNITKKNIILIIIGILMSGVSIIASMASPFIMQAIIDDAIGKNNIDLLMTLTLFLTLIIFVGYMFELLNIYFFTKISKEFTRAVFHKIIKNLCLKNNNFFVDQSSGEINERINEAWELEDIFSADFFSSIYSIPMLIIATFVLINTSIEITIITFIGVIISVIFIGLSNSFIGKHMQDVLNKRMNVSSKVQEMILGIYEIRSNSANRLFGSKIDDAVDKKCKTSLKFSMGITFYMRTSSLFASLLSIFLLYYCGKNIIHGTLTIGTYFLITSYVQKVTEPLMELTSIVSVIKPLLVTSKRIEEKFRLDSIDFTEENKSVNSDISKLSINNIYFKYPGMLKPIINDFNLNARKGDIVLIKGANGSGKTTLLNILCGELKQQKGEILFDENNEYSQNYLSVARQRPFVFNLSLKDNIILAEDYSEERYKKILTYFKFSDYFNTDIINGSVSIQENGNDLSGGQIKLIAIARCFYRNRSIIILDEIISNLDSNLRKVVVDYIKSIKDKHIFILVEHTKEYDYLANKTIELECSESSSIEVKI